MIQKALQSFSTLGLLLGLAFFCASLTPSLLPRPTLLQGMLSGVVFAVGYGVGIAVRSIWRLLQVPDLTLPTRFESGLIILAVVGSIATLVRAPVWQNSIRQVMEMDPVQAGAPFQIAGIAVATALVLILLTRLLLFAGHRFVGTITRLIPTRLATGLGVFLFLAALILLVDGFVVKRSLTAMDNAFAALDRTIDNDATAPSVPTNSGSPNSLISWDSIGRTGKNFVSTGADAAQIAEVTGRPALEPVRIYAGYNSGETLEERAALALADLTRADGFERSTLVVATVTGTGWMDPAAVEPLVHLLDGDVAIVTLQYSYLPSWLTLLVDPNRSRRAAQAMFDAIYDQWTRMPKATRPKLYLFGLSLGALGSESSVDLITLFDDPIDGALWVGPPFASTIWPQVLAGREPGSPQWRPIFRDSSLIRFMTRDGMATAPNAQWGKMRLLYLQHASDPMSFFSPSLAVRRPDWLVDRGSDISPFFDWYPLVTFFQVLFDIPLATSVPAGYGHTFTLESYFDAWIEVLDVDARPFTEVIDIKSRLLKRSRNR